MECQLWIEGKGSKSAFAKLLDQREAIVSILGSKVVFDEMPGRGPCKIYEVMSGDVSDRSEWRAIHRWLKERGEAYAGVFKPLVSQLEVERRDRVPMHGEVFGTLQWPDRFFIFPMIRND